VAYLSTYFVAWAALAAGVAGLAVYRKLVSMHEDTCLHLSDGEARLRSAQVAVFRQLDIVDRWGKTLTVLIAISGAILLALYLYQIWPEN
jgi:hypothetical protein